MESEIYLGSKEVELLVLGLCVYLIEKKLYKEELFIIKLRNIS